MATAASTTPLYATADVAPPSEHSYVVDQESANAIGATTALANDAIDIARIDDSHLSECTQASHLSACTAETHASVITEDSMLNNEPLPVTAVAPSGDQAEVNPESYSYKGFAQLRIVCSASSNEIHFTTPETEVRSPNDPLVDTDSLANHRLSAVSNIAAAGLGGDLGSYSPPTVYGSASAEGEVGLRVHPASPMTHENVIPNGGDRSGATPGHAPPNYEHAPTPHYAPSAFHHPPAHAMGSSTSVSQHNNRPKCIASVWTYDNSYDNNDATTGGAGNTSSHNGNQGWFDTIAMGVPPFLVAGRYANTSKGKGIGGVLTGRVHVAHDPGQAPETFVAQALHGVRWPGGSQDLPGGYASAFDAHGGTIPEQQLIHNASRFASTTPMPLVGDFAARTALLPDVVDEPQGSGV
jgi:hypothetical protein